MWIDPSESGTNPLPADLRDHVGEWILRNPSHTHRLWSLPEVLALCEASNRPDVADVIGKCRFPSMKADVARLFLMEQLGGFWCDLKLLPRRALPEELHRFSAVFIEHFPKPELPVPGGLLVNSFIAAMPHAPVISYALELAMENVRMRHGNGIFEITGPAALSMAWQSYRLGFPEAARTVFVIPHQSGWGALWDVAPDNYNAPGLHWSVRQQHESPFADEWPVADGPREATGLFKAIPGHATRIDRIHSSQGFHPFEPSAGFSWLSDATASRIFFDAVLPFNWLRLKIYALEGVNLSDVTYLLNGQPVPCHANQDQDGWGLVELGPFDVRASWNELIIHPPVFVSPKLGGPDQRKLSIALASVQPFIPLTHNG